MSVDSKLRLIPPLGVLLLWTACWIRWSQIYRITSNMQKPFQKQLSIPLMEFEAGCEAMRSHEVWKTIELGVSHFGYLTMHLVSQISQSILPMGCGDNFTTTISEWLHISNVKRYIILPTRWVTFNRCWSRMTSVLVLTIWRRDGGTLTFKNCTVLTLEMCSTYYLLPIRSEILGDPILYTSSIVRMCHFSTL